MAGADRDPAGARRTHGGQPGAWGRDSGPWTESPGWARPFPLRFGEKRHRERM